MSPQGRASTPYAGRRAPGAQQSTVYVVGGPFAAVEGWRAELLINGMEYDFDCSYKNTTHVACAVSIDSGRARWEGATSTYSYMTRPPRQVRRVLGLARY